jgi:hypothetical protein
MNTVIISAFLLVTAFAATSAQACQVPEAQIIATVIQSDLAGAECETVIELDHVSPHKFCPLNLQVGQRVSMRVQKRGDRCPLSGEAISGVAQKIDGKLRLDE